MIVLMSLVYGSGYITALLQWHVYTIANSLMERMDLKESETNSDPTPSTAFSRHWHMSGPIIANFIVVIDVWPIGRLTQ
jgi:hypothetical protein